MLYIQSNHKEKVHYTQGNWVIKHKDRTRTQYLLHEALTEITSAQPIILSSSCTLVHAECMRYLIITISPFQLSCLHKSDQHFKFSNHMSCFFVGLMIACPWLSTAMKYSLCGGLSWYMNIRNPFHEVSVLCFSLTKATTISLQNLESYSSLEQSDW